MHPPVDLVAVDLCLKSALHLPSRAGKGYPVAPARCLANLKTLRGQPCVYFAQIVRADAKSIGILLRRQPVVEVRRRGVLLLRQQLIERSLLRRRGLKSDRDSGKSEGIRNRAGIVAGPGPGMHKPMQRRALAIIHRRSQAVALGEQAYCGKTTD